MRVLLVTDDWRREVEIAVLEDTIEAEGMTWEREGLHHADESPEGAPSLPRFVPAVSG